MQGGGHLEPEDIAVSTTSAPLSASPNPKNHQPPFSQPSMFNAHLIKPHLLRLHWSTPALFPFPGHLPHPSTRSPNPPCISRMNINNHKRFHKHNYCGDIRSIMLILDLLGRNRRRPPRGTGITRSPEGGFIAEVVFALTSIMHRFKSTRRLYQECPVDDADGSIRKRRIRRLQKSVRLVVQVCISDPYYFPLMFTLHFDCPTSYCQRRAIVHFPFSAGYDAQPSPSPPVLVIHLKHLCCD